MHLKLSNDFVEIEQLIGPLPNFDGNFESFFVPKAFQSVFGKSFPTSNKQSETAMVSIQNKNDLVWLSEIELAKDSKQQNVEIIFNYKQIFFKATRRLAKNEFLYAFPSKDLEIALGLQYVPQNSDKNYFCKKCMLNLNHQFDLMLHIRYFCSSYANSCVNSASLRNNLGNGISATSNKRKIPNELLGINKKLKEPLATNFLQTNYDLKHEVLGNQFHNPLNNSAMNSFAYVNSIQNFLNSYSTLPYFTNQVYHQKLMECLRNSEFSNLISAYLQTLAKNEQNQDTVKSQIDSTIRKFDSSQNSLYRIPISNNSVSSNSSEKSSSSLENLQENLQQSNPHLDSKKAQLTYDKTSLQNWCAKCNTFFRLTSDLVYHMRTFHKKSESNSCGSKCDVNKIESIFGDKDPNMTKSIANKEIKGLRCEICNEIFKEKHHLSRHMTSHR